MDVRPTRSQGEDFHRAGDLARAEGVYRAVLRSEPADAQAWFLLGAVCQATGRADEAMASFRRSIALRPEHAPAWNLLGVALAAQGRLAEAEPCFLRALRILPDHAEAAHNLERARRGRPVAGPPPSFESCCLRAYELCEQGRPDQAEPWFVQALAIRPDSPDLLNDLGKALALQSRHEEAAACFRHALDLDPGHARAHLNLAATLFELGRLDEADSSASEAARLEPENPSVYNNRGLILGQLGRLSEAEQAFRDGLRLAPDHPDLHANLATMLVLAGRAPEAQSHYRRAMELRPDAHAIHSNWLLSRQYLPGNTPAALLGPHRAWDHQHAARLRSAWRPHDNDRDPDRPLRLGFVSPDFQRHPVGFFIIRTLEGLRPLDGETYCYMTGSGGDAMTARIAAASTAWRPSRALGDDELAEQIRRDRIDLLFDLAGHTSRNRLLVFARKPAPIQLTWLGYDGTTGLAAMDDLVADPYLVPEGAEASYRERVLRLPDCYLCYDPPADAPEVGPLPAAASGYVTFGSFNNPAKVGPGVVDAWAEILARIPSARLLLKYKGFDDGAMIRHFLGLLSAQGIDPGRVTLEGWSPHRETLAAYNRVDIALDPFPYAGCLTTCEALWMGVPVLTRPESTFVSRHSLTLLSNLGLTATIAKDLAQYVDIAVRLAGDLPRLADLRAGLRPRMAGSPLCDGPRHADDLLRALRARWRAWCIARGR